MKSKLIFRILGALASALIIVSVFIPFEKVLGYSQSLWKINSNTIYLPIMIIVFGAIGVLVFSLNIKTELAYATAGALLFFLIMRTVPIIDQGVFGALNVGYYGLAVGTVLTAVMAFLCGLKLKQKVQEVDSSETRQLSMLDQIDRLYDNENNEENDVTISQIDVIQPLQPTNSLSDNLIEPIKPITVEKTINQASEVPTQNNLVSGQINETIQPVQEQSIETQNINIDNQQIIPPTIVEKTNIQQNVSLQNLDSQSQQVSNNNPVNVEFESPVSSNVNPVISEFSPQNNSTGINPVVAEFSIPSEPVILSNPVVEEQMQPIQKEEAVKPLSSDRMSTLLKEQDNNKSNLDIFS